MSLGSRIRVCSYVLAGVIAVGVGATALTAQSPSNQARYDPNRDYPPTADDYSSYALPAFVSVVDGYAELDREGQSSRDIENVPLEEGDRLRTTRGRAEVLFEDGSVIALDEHTAVTFVSASEVELEAGRLRTQWRDRDQRSTLTIHTLAGRAILRNQGDYRVTLAESRRGDAEIELAVVRGSAELANEHGRTAVRQGTRALTTAGYAPSTPYAFSAPRDAFERWTDSLDGDRYGVESARYLPDDLRYYGGVFDRHGAWQHHHSHGWVWYPRVSTGWRPYEGGRWSFVVGFGYSWIGGSRWAWPTHHHGRWDRLGSNYFWIPGRPTHRRVVGYAAPRPSYTTNVNYYSRPSTDRNVRPQPGVRDAQRAVPRSTFQTPRPSVTEQRPRERTAPVAVPRNSRVGASPQSTPQPHRRPLGSAQPREPREPQRAEPTRPPQSAPQPPRATRTPEAQPRPLERQPTAPRTSERPAEGPREGSRARPQRAEPAPAPERRSPPSATSPPPPSGSRMPSREATPPSGTAARRRPGGGQ